MPLQLVTGAANAGKTGVLHQLLADAVSAGARATLLLPSFAEVPRARSELSVKVPIGLDISTLDVWAGHLWGEVGDGRRLVSPLLRRAVMSQAIASVALKAVRESATTPGFVQVMSTVAARLCNSVTDSIPRSRELAEVKAILVAYEGLLMSLGLVELSRAQAAMSGIDLPPLGFLAVNRFSDLSEAQENLLLAASATSDVALALTWEREGVATEALAALVGRLVEQGASHHVCVTPQGGGELEQVAERLMRPVGGPPIVPTGSVELGSAAGDEAEIELVADRVRERVDRGVRAERIAIVFRAPGSRPSKLEAALRERGIRVNVDTVGAFGQTHFGQAVLALLQAARGEGSRGDFMAFVNSPYSGLSQEAASELERRWRRSRKSDPSALLDAAAKESPRTARVVATARAAVRGHIDRHSIRTWKELADAASEASFSTRGASAGSAESIDLADAAAHRALLNAMQEAAAVGSFSGAEFIDALPELPVSSGIKETEGAVQLLDAAKARVRRFDVVILGGLTAAEFSAEKPEPLQARIEKAFGGRGGTDERLSERMLFYTLVTRARERLILLRQSSDSSGEPVRPSVFWEDVVDLYAEPGDDDGRPRLPEGLPQPAVRLSELADAVPAFTGRRRQQRRAAEQGTATLERGLSTALLTETVGLAGREMFSVTELESYAFCPYRWFIERGLRPRDIDAALDAREMGTRAHEMLARFYQVLPGRLGVRRLDLSTVEPGLVLFDSVADEVEHERRDAGRTTLAEELDMAVARQRARSIVENDATFLPGYEPLETEWTFEYQIDSESGPALLKGKVDRIDVGPAGVVVTDYKLSSIHGVASWSKLRVLQVPLYAAIAADRLGRPVAGGIYRSLAKRSARGVWLKDKVPIAGGNKTADATDETGLNEAIDFAFDLAARCVDGIRSGRIEPEPAHDQACRYCSAAPFCEKACP